MKFSFFGKGVKAFYRENQKAIEGFISGTRKFEPAADLEIGVAARVMEDGDLIVKKTIGLQNPPPSIKKFIVPTVFAKENDYDFVWVFQKRAEETNRRPTKQPDRTWISKILKIQPIEIVDRLGMTSSEFCGVDVHYENVGIDENGKFVIFDW